MKVGMTGTQQGATLVQLEQCQSLLQSLKAKELHHGDCVGADYEAHTIGLKLGLRLVVHPPEDSKKRMFVAGHETREMKPYLVRNRDIVDETEVLVALPSGPEVTRSGTWSTVRYARKKLREVYVIMPDGRIV